MPLPKAFNGLFGAAKAVGTAGKAIGKGIKTYVGGLSHGTGGTIGERTWGLATKGSLLVGGVLGATALSAKAGEAIARDRTTFGGTSERFNRNGYSATVANGVSTGQFRPDELGENDYSKLNQRFSSTFHDKPRKETMEKAANALLVGSAMAGLEFMGYKDTKAKYTAQAKLPKANPPQVTGMKQPSFF